MAAVVELAEEVELVWQAVLAVLEQVALVVRVFHSTLVVDLHLMRIA